MFTTEIRYPRWSLKILELKKNTRIPSGFISYFSRFRSSWPIFRGQKLNGLTYPNHKTAKILESQIWVAAWGILGIRVATKLILSIHSGSSDSQNWICDQWEINNENDQNQVQNWPITFLIRLGLSHTGSSGYSSVLSQ